LRATIANSSLRRNRKHSLHHDVSTFNELARQHPRKAKPMVSDLLKRIPVYQNEFDFKTARRQSLHEISYGRVSSHSCRAFLSSDSQSREYVFDPFMGRGTTLLRQACLGVFHPAATVNPTLPKVNCRRDLIRPLFWKFKARLQRLILRLMPKRRRLVGIYHPQTLQQICALRVLFD